MHARHIGHAHRVTTVCIVQRLIGNKAVDVGRFEARII